MSLLLEQDREHWTLGNLRSTDRPKAVMTEVRETKTEEEAKSSLDIAALQTRSREIERKNLRRILSV